MSLTPEEIAAERDARLKRRREQAERDLKEVLSSPEGRRFVWSLLDERCGVFGLSYSGAAEETNFREGRRAVGVELMADAQRVASTRYVQMLNEQLQAAEEERLIRAVEARRIDGQQ